MAARCSNRLLLLALTCVACEGFATHTSRQRPGDSVLKAPAERRGWGNHAPQLYAEGGGMVGLREGALQAAGGAQEKPKTPFSTGLPMHSR